MARREDGKADSAIPEVDRLEQEQPADPSVAPDQQWPRHPTPDADEADRLEQAHEVLADTDEEYSPTSE
jgi:hypothetical protein